MEPDSGFQSSLVWHSRRAQEETVDRVPCYWLIPCKRSTHRNLDCSGKNGFFLPKNRPDLLHVVHIVPGHVTREVANRDASALCMNAVSLPFLIGEIVEHPQVRFAQQAEHFERIGRLPRAIVPHPRP